MAKVQFFKGTYANYSKLDASAKETGIYFATDRPFIFAAGQEVGIDGSIVKDFEWVDASNALKVTYKDGSEKVVTVPVADASKNGLMSKEDYTKLAGIKTAWFGDGHQESDRLVWTVDISAFATKSYVDDEVAKKIDASGVIEILDASLAPYAKTEDVSANYVHVETGKRLMTDEEGTKLSGIAAGAEVNVIEGIVEGDHILSIDGSKNLKSTLSINYDSSERKIQLKGIDGSVFSEFDASAFVKDGILYGSAMVKADASGNAHVIIRDTSTDLSGLTPNHQHLVLCFSTFDGEEFKFDWHAIDVEALIDVYTAGPGISIDGSNNISVNVGEDTSVNKNFLDMEGDASLAVRSVDADCVPTVEDVEVLGGPLAGQVTNWPSSWYKDGKKIVPANLSMQDFITGLYFQEIKGKVNKGYYVWTPTLAQPNASLSSTATQEVGAQLTATYSTNATINNNTRSITVSQDANNFGMFIGDTYQTGNKTFSKNGTPSGDIHIENATWNNTAISESSASVTVVEGTNTLYVKQSGLHAMVDGFSGEPVCYGATNQHKKNSDSSVNVNESEPFYDKSLSSDKSVTVTGRYPIYVNGVGSATAYDENTACPVPTDVARVADTGTKLALVADNTLFTVNFPTMIDGGEGWCIAIQKDKSITYAKSRNGLTGKCTDDIKSEFVKSSTTITKMSGGVATDYYVWEHKGTKGYNYVSLKID